MVKNQLPATTSIRRKCLMCNELRDPDRKKYCSTQCKRLAKETGQASKVRFCGKCRSFYIRGTVKRCLDCQQKRLAKRKAKRERKQARAAAKPSPKTAVEPVEENAPKPPTFDVSNSWIPQPMLGHAREMSKNLDTIIGRPSGIPKKDREKTALEARKAIKRMNRASRGLKRSREEDDDQFGQEKLEAKPDHVSAFDPTVNLEDAASKPAPRKRSRNARWSPHTCFDDMLVLDDDYNEYEERELLQTITNTNFGYKSGEGIFPDGTGWEYNFHSD